MQQHGGFVQPGPLEGSKLTLPAQTLAGNDGSYRDQAKAIALGTGLSMSGGVLRAVGAAFDGAVATWADLPVGLEAPVVESVYLVRSGSGVWLLNRKKSGLWQRVAATGDRTADWSYLGEWLEEFSDANFEVWHDDDTTRGLKFSLADQPTGTTVTVRSNDLETLGTMAAGWSGVSGHLLRTDNPHAVTAAQVGLGSVDNTRDADKPVSTAQAAAIATRAPLVHGHAAEDISDSTYVGRSLLTAASAAVQRGILGLTGWATNQWTNGTTDDVPEGVQLYFTNARADARADARIAAQKGQADGLAPLDAGGKVPSANLPDSIAQADDAARLGGQLPSYYAQAGHVHNYAGSSTPGGAATSALECTGNAATATALATPRTLTIGSKANTFDGSSDKAWALAEIGAASIVSYNDIRATLYSGQCGNSSCRIPVASTGDGTGVLTIRLFSSTSNTAKLSAGYFCSDAGGGTNLGMSMTMQSGQYSEIFVKLTSGSSEIVIENGWALTEWGHINIPCITEATNGPKLNGFDVGFIPANSTGINLYANASLSSVVGTPRPWQNAGVVQLLGSGFSVNGPVHPMTSSAYTLLVGNSMVLTANLFECCRTMEQQFIYIDGAQVAVSYPASRRWPSVMRGMFIRPATGTFPSSDVDRLFNDLAQWCTAITLESIFDLRGNCGAATANSYAARSYLAGLGAAVYVNI